MACLVLRIGYAKHDMGYHSIPNLSWIYLPPKYEKVCESHVLLCHTRFERGISDKEAVVYLHEQLGIILMPEKVSKHKILRMRLQLPEPFYREVILTPSLASQTLCPFDWINQAKTTDIIKQEYVFIIPCYNLSYFEVRNFKLNP